MKNKKGFTLIELLAVIVILAIIALITTPIVLNMINSARKSAAKSSALGYIDAIEYNNGFAELDQPGYTMITGTKQVSELSGLKFKGKAPESGSVTVDNDGKVTTATLCINDYEVEYTRPEVTDVTKGCSGGSTPEPVYNWNEYSTAVSSCTSGCIYDDVVMYMRGDSVQKYGEVCMILDGNTVCAGPNSNGRQSDFENASSEVVTGYTEEKRQEMLSKWNNVTCTVNQNQLRCTHPYEYSNQWEYYFLITKNGGVELGLNDGNNNVEYCYASSNLNSYSCCDDFNCNSLNYD